jgi:hypothetical protein
MREIQKGSEEGKGRGIQKERKRQKKKTPPGELCGRELLCQSA